MKISDITLDISLDFHYNILDIKFTNFRLQCQGIRLLMEFEFTDQTTTGKTYKVAVELKDSVYVAYIEGKKFEVDARWLSENTLLLIIDNKVYTAHVAEDKSKKYVAIGGEQYCFAEAKAGSERRFVTGSTPSGGVTEEGRHFVSSPMPGMVIKINVNEEQRVEVNQSLVVVEAMKMENEIRSPIKGKVKKINCAVGSLVGVNEPIIELEPEEIVGENPIDRP